MLAVSKSPEREVECSSSGRSTSLGCCASAGLSFLLVGEDLGQRLAERIPAEGFRGRLHALHVLCPCPQVVETQIRKLQQYRDAPRTK
jgi:hypothetical protein